MDVKDGLVAIAGEVLGDVQKEAEALILAAEKEAKKALQAAKAQADQDYLTLIDQAKVKAEAEQRRIASLTEVEIRNQAASHKRRISRQSLRNSARQAQGFCRNPKVP